MISFRRTLLPATLLAAAAVAVPVAANAAGPAAPASAPAAAAASASVSVSASASASTESVRLYTDLGAGPSGTHKYAAFAVDGSTLTSPVHFVASETTAADASAQATVPVPGATGEVVIDGKCLTVSTEWAPGGDRDLIVADCDGSAEQTWTRTARGGLETASTAPSADHRYFGNFGDAGDAASLMADDDVTVGATFGG